MQGEVAIMNLERYGPWALIIGGSEGIGAAFARKLAARKFNIALVARKEPPLAELAAELRTDRVEVRTLSADLSKADVVDKVAALTADIEVGFLIYVAGANSIRGNIVDLDPEIYRSVIAVNVIGPVEFVRHYGALMKKRGHGGIILTGSSSNYIGSATLGPYTASKAFSRIFSESLWAECKPMGIDVLHMVVGFTATPAMLRLGLDTSTAQSPGEVAQEALENMHNGPLLILGGPKALETAVRRSVLVDRGALIATVATPNRANMPHKKN
jgi:short-subunit dehydrogenase